MSAASVSSNSECSSFFTTDLRTTFVGFDRISALVLPFFLGAVFFTAFFGAAFFVVFVFLTGVPSIVCAGASFFLATFILSFRTHCFKPQVGPMLVSIFNVTFRSDRIARNDGT